MKPKNWCRESVSSAVSAVKNSCIQNIEKASSVKINYLYMMIGVDFGFYGTVSPGLEKLVPEIPLMSMMVIGSCFLY
jgi:hypothetical protein